MDRRDPVATRREGSLRVRDRDEHGAWVVVDGAEKRVFVRPSVDGAYDGHRRLVGHVEAVMIDVAVDHIEVGRSLEHHRRSAPELLRRVWLESVVPESLANRWDDISGKRGIAGREERDVVAAVGQPLGEHADDSLDAAITSRRDRQKRRGDERDLHSALLINTGRADSAAKLGRALSHPEVEPRESVTVAYDPQRSRVPLHPLAEAGARVAYAWVRNQRSFRDSRPLIRYALKTAQFFALRDQQPTVETDMAGLRVLVRTSDGTIARSVYVSGDWDPLMVGGVYDALDRYGQAYRGRTFLEVGANFGVYALPAVARHGFGHAIAYEPDPAAYELLQRNIERNGLGLRVAAVNAALSAAPGELTLQLGTHNAGDNRIIDDSNGGSNGETLGRTNGANTVTVPATTFDDEVAAGNIPLEDLALVWLDVQGHELEVLKGARSLLSAGVPLVVEFASEMGDRAQLEELANLLADNYEAMVDLGWCGLTNRLRFQPAWATRMLAADGRDIETDLLLLPRRT